MYIGLNIENLSKCFSVSLFVTANTCDNITNWLMHSMCHLAKAYKYYSFL